MVIIMLRRLQYKTIPRVWVNVSASRSFAGSNPEGRKVDITDPQNRKPEQSDNYFAQKVTDHSDAVKKNPSSKEQPVSGTKPASPQNVDKSTE